MPSYIPPRGRVRSADRAAGRRLQALFCATWSQLPTAVQRQLYRYWCPAGVTLRVRPQLATWARRPGLLAGCRQRGRLLVFGGSFLALMGPDLGKAVVGHELAHAFCCSQTGYHGSEDLADALTASWGLPMAQLRAELRALTGR